MKNILFIQSRPRGSQSYAQKVAQSISAQFSASSGLTDIDVVHVEGVATSASGPEKAVASAMAHSTEVLTAVA